MSARIKLKREKFIRLNITMPPLLVIQLEDIIRRNGFAGPADYFQNCVRTRAGEPAKAA